MSAAVRPPMNRRQAVKLLGTLSLGPFALAEVPDRPWPTTKFRTFRRSDVVMAFVFTPEVYRRWHANVLYGWCRAPETEAEIPQYQHRLKEALDAGVRMGASINAFYSSLTWFQENDPDWANGVIRDFRGAVLNPWGPKGPLTPDQGIICTNHPRHLERKLHETELALSVGAYAFHVDDPLGTATVLRANPIGCFCKYCMAGFRKYLKKYATPETLHAVGAIDLVSFDYGKFLRGREDRPLWREFENFQWRASMENLQKILEAARRKRGDRIPMGANAPLVWPHIIFAPELDYIAAEVGTEAAQKKFSVKPMMNYKMGDALKVDVAATGIYRDWAALTLHDMPDLVRGWVAEAYAFGHHFIVPHEEWGFVRDPKTGIPQKTAYPAKVELIGPVYKFVRDYPELFDGYEAVRQVAVLYDYEAIRRSAEAGRLPSVNDVALDLANANIPFGMVVAGSEPFEYELTQDQLERYELVIVNDPVRMEGKQRDLLDSWRRKQRVIRWESIAGVESRLQRLIAVEPAGGNVWALPRVISGNKDAPLVCHVLNRDFDKTVEKLTPQKDVKIGLHKKLFAGRKHGKCTLFVERQPPHALPVRVRRDMVEVTLPELELWGVLRFT